MAARNRYLTEEETLKILSAFSPMSPHDFAEEAGIDASTATQRLRAYMKAGWLHIGRFERHEGLATQYACYEIGRHKNARRVAKMTEQERTKRYRERVKADKKRYKQKLKKQRAYYHERKREDPMYMAKRRKRSTEWKRATFGYKPRQVIVTNQKDVVLAMSDEKNAALAALMGRK